MRGGEPSLPAPSPCSRRPVSGELLAERSKAIVGSEGAHGLAPAASPGLGVLLCAHSLLPFASGVIFEKPRGKPFHGKMAALVTSVRAGGIAV